MAVGGGEVSKLVAVWLANLSKAEDHESWGQPVEASDLYRKLSKAIRTTIPENISISDGNKRQLTKLSATLDQRAKLAADPTNEVATDNTDIKKFLEALQAGKEVVCQLNSPIKIPLKSDEVVIDDNDEEDDEDQIVPYITEATLLPQPSYVKNRTYLTIHVHKIGIKDPHNYIEPSIRIFVKDTAAKDCEPVQQTPVSHCREITYFVFDVDVHIQTPVEDLPSGAAIFFELNHYKPKKTRLSTRCFSFMELDEIKDGPACLEIYKKPTDFKKKKLLLLSVKPLYLHLTLSLHKLTEIR